MKSPKPNRVLFLSNCYGEDRSAALIASKIRELVPNISPIGMSLISNGAEYEKRGISVLMKNKTPPSGGFTRSLSALMKDVPYFYIPIRYLIELKRIRHKVKEAIVVGDVFLLVLGWLGLHRKMVFLAPAKSDYQVPHSKLEKLLMRKMAIQVFTHDELTAINLRKEGVLALFLGNPMVDGLCEIPNPPANAGSRKKRDKSQIPKSKNFIGILPGSRNEGYKNFLKILLVVQRVCELREDISFISAIPATINLQKLVTFAQKEGWMYESQSLLKGKAKVLLLYDAFVDVVAHSDIIIGLAGTANEQAAALGKPIVSFVGCGAQTSYRRMINQEKLLGGCLKLKISNFPDGCVTEILSLLEDEELRKKRGNIGRERMGPKGGAKKIAEFIIKRKFKCQIKSKPQMIKREGAF